MWLAALAGEYVLLRWWFRRALSVRGHRDPLPAERVPRLPLPVVATVLLGFVATSPPGIAPAWIAGAGGAVLAGVALTTGVTRWRRLLVTAHLPFCWFVLCWGVVVAGVADSALGDGVRAAVPDAPGQPVLAAVALVAAVAANLLNNLLNNLPATLLLLPVVAPLGPLALLALLVGVDLGSNLTYMPARWPTCCGDGP